MAQPVWTEVEGWLLPDEADLLRKYSDGVWCEIGSWKGKSTLVLAESGRGYAIDTFTGSAEHGDVDTFADFIQNTQHLKNVTAIRGDFRIAHEYIPELDFLYLDADHSYEATKEAFEMYAPKVKKGGVVVLHDAWGYDGDTEKSEYPGVQKFALEILEDERWEHLENVRRCLAIRRLS